MKRFLICLFAAVALTGCVSSSKVPTINEFDNLIEFTKKLKTSTSGNGLDTMLVSMMGEEDDKATYSTYKTWWCPRHKTINSAPRVAEQFAKVCHERGGEFKRWFCRDRQDYDNVLFYSKVESITKCSIGQSADVTIIEPKSDTRDTRYLLALSAVGNKSKAAELAAQERRELKKEIENALKAKKAQRDRELKKMVGTRVCKPLSQHLEAIGFIEQVNERKIKIQMNRVGLNASNEVVWDFPENWDVCE